MNFNIYIRMTRIRSGGFAKRITLWQKIKKIKYPTMNYYI